MPVYTLGMRIIGIDPGTGILGFGVIDVTGGKTQLVDAGVIRTPVKEDDAVRLETIFQELTDIIMHTKPTVISVEKLFFARNVTTAMTVSQARGVVLLCARLNNTRPCKLSWPLRVMAKQIKNKCKKWCAFCLN